MYQVVKRNGKIAEFDSQKIKSAIQRAFEAQNRPCYNEIIDTLVLRVVADSEGKAKDGAVSVEDIQDSVESVLIAAGYADVAKSYILYRKQHEKVRNAKSTILDYKKLVDDYLQVKDWRVKENSTVTYSVGGLILSNSGAITANYWLSEVYDDEIANAHRNADIHIHDLSMLTGYCFTGDTRVKTVNGKNPTFSELVTNGVQEVGVYACDARTGEIVEVKAKYPRITRVAWDITYVTLMDGTVIRCTPDHPFMLRDGSFSRAENLEPDVALMGFTMSSNGQAETCSRFVRNVSKVHLKNPIKVYDLTVPDYHNFALDSGLFVHNCAGWSLKQLIQEGLGGVPGKITSAPASHLSTLCNQMVNFLGILQNEWSGAQAFSSFDTYLAPFVKADGLSYKEVKQCIQSFVFGNNTPSRWGTQSPFTNITLDWTVPDDLAELNAIVGGKEMNFKYKDCKKEMDMINKAFIEVMLEGDANGRGFQYPIPSYSITKNFDWSETENNKLLFEMTAKYGTPYFSNYVNSDMEPSDIRSMCCRLRLDLRELRKKSGGYFGSGESTGSVGVVTINMPRIAYLSKNENEFYQRLDHMMDIAARSLKTKRTVITQFMENGLYPYTKRYLGSFNNHFSTIGLVGMNEACLNAKWIGEDLSHKKAHQFTVNVLNHMRERLSDYQEQYGDLYNLEATPAESTTYRLAKHDKERYPDIITAAGDCGTPYYTNSSHLPVGFTDDMFAALDIQDDLQTLYTSGTVFHAYLGEKLPDWRAAMTLVRKIAENYKLPYYTISPTYSICKNDGYLSGEHFHCPKCGSPAEVYSRITGYYRPVQNWNDGKAQEYKDRKTYDVLHAHAMLAQNCNDALNRPITPNESSWEKGENATRLMLFTTKTCPNCRIAKAALDREGVQYTVIDAEESPELAAQYDIRQAPTLVVDTGAGEARKVLNASNIIAFAKKQNAEKE